MWIEYQSLYDIIQELATLDHHWKNEAIRIQLGKNNSEEFTSKKYVLFKSITKHLFNNVATCPLSKVLYIHWHHFPIALLQWRENHPRSYLATSLSHEDANSISVNDLGQNRFTEFNNSVYYLNNIGLKKTQSTRKLLTSAYKKQYLQSLFTTHDEITSYVNIL